MSFLEEKKNDIGSNDSRFNSPNTTFDTLLAGIEQNGTPNNTPNKPPVELSVVEKKRNRIQEEYQKYIREAEQRYFEIETIDFSKKNAQEIINLAKDTLKDLKNLDDDTYSQKLKNNLSVPAYIWLMIGHYHNENYVNSLNDWKNIQRIIKKINQTEGEYVEGHLDKVAKFIEGCRNCVENKYPEALKLLGEGQCETKVLKPHVLFCRAISNFELGRFGQAKRNFKLLKNVLSPEGDFLNFHFKGAEITVGYIEDYIDQCDPMYYEEESTGDGKKKKRTRVSCKPFGPLQRKRWKKRKAADDLIEKSYKLYLRCDFNKALQLAEQAQTKCEQSIYPYIFTGVLQFLLGKKIPNARNKLTKLVITGKKKKQKSWVTKRRFNRQYTGIFKVAELIDGCFDNLKKDYLAAIEKLTSDEVENFLNDTGEGEDSKVNKVIKIHLLFARGRAYYQIALERAKLEEVPKYKAEDGKNSHYYFNLAHKDFIQANEIIIADYEKLIKCFNADVFDEFRNRYSLIMMCEYHMGRFFGLQVVNEKPEDQNDETLDSAFNYFEKAHQNLETIYGFVQNKMEWNKFLFRINHNHPESELFRLMELRADVLQTKGETRKANEAYNQLVQVYKYATNPAEAFRICCYRLHMDLSTALTETFGEENYQLKFLKNSEAFARLKEQFSLKSEEWDELKSGLELKIKQLECAKNKVEKEMSDIAGTLDLNLDDFSLNEETLSAIKSEAEKLKQQVKEVSDEKDNLNKSFLGEQNEREKDKLNSSQLQKSQSEKIKELEKKIEEREKKNKNINLRLDELDNSLKPTTQNPNERDADPLLDQSIEIIDGNTSSLELDKNETTEDKIQKNNY
jgi:hypothetical protein